MLFLLKNILLISRTQMTLEIKIDQYLFLTRFFHSLITLNRQHMLVLLISGINIIKAQAENSYRFTLQRVQSESKCLNYRTFQNFSFTRDGNV